MRARACVTVTQPLSVSRPRLLPFSAARLLLTVGRIGWRGARGAFPDRTEQFCVLLRAKRDDFVGSRGTSWTSLLGVDGPNSANERFYAAGGEASAFSNFLRVLTRHITAKL